MIGRISPASMAGHTCSRTSATIAAFSDTFREPDHARAAVQMYRVFNLREAPEIARGRYAKAHLKVPTHLLFGTGDQALKHTLLAGYERHADDMQLEKVDGCGHFIADEMPDLVAERAREFFASA